MLPARIPVSNFSEADLRQVTLPRVMLRVASPAEIRRNQALPRSHLTEGSVEGTADREFSLFDRRYIAACARRWAASLQSYRPENTLPLMSEAVGKTC